MAKRTRLPALNPAELIGFEQKLSATKISKAQKRTIMASMKVAANPESETPEFGYASLPNERRNIASKSIQDTGSVFSAISNNVTIDFEEQQEINTAIMEAQADGKDRIDWRIVVGLLAFFLFPQAQEQTLYDAILDAYVSAWQLAIREQAVKYGCPYARVGNPSGASLREIKRYVKRDAESIVKTYNTNAQSALKKLYEANPLGSVSYYLSGMQEWANTRQMQRNLMISITNVQEGYGIGLRDFVTNNQIETMFRLVGPPPVCPTCSYIMGLGQVDYQTVISFGWGLIHINCPHRWETTRTYRIDCTKMWTG